MPDHYSNSQIEMFLGRCAEQWRRRYLEHDIIPPGIALHIGSGFHKAAEINYEAKKLTRMDEPLDVCLDAAVDQYDAKLRELGILLQQEDVPAVKKILGEGKDRLVEFTTKWHEKVAPIYQPNMVEQRFSISLPGVEKPIVGAMDLVSEDKILSDLKSGTRPWTPARVQSSSQMTVYKEAYRQLTGEAPSRMRFDTVIQYENGFFYEPWDTDRDEEDLAILVKRFQIMERMIKAGVFPPTQNIDGGYPCSANWCGYYHTCQYIKRKVFVDVRGK